MDGRTIYAQASDIKSRTFLEYRKDMKRKAIIELELLEWLNKKIPQKYGKHVRVSKAGGDAFLWFLRKGGITREPDYQINNEDSLRAIEMQYGSNLISQGIYDFKISKISSKVRGQSIRSPKEELLIFYLFEDSPTKYAFLKPKWIQKNSSQGVSPAWGNAPTYKLPGEQMLTQVHDDHSLSLVWKQVKGKWALLDFQHSSIENTKNRLSSLLQKNIDEEKLIKIIPNSLESFFTVCFLLDTMQKIPESLNTWLVYVLSYINKNSSSEDIFKIVYCMDFLYTKTELPPNELQLVTNAITDLLSILKSLAQPNGSYSSDKHLSPVEETRYCLFAINLLEDMSQDILHYYPSAKTLQAIKKIYENVPRLQKTVKFISS